MMESKELLKKIDRFPPKLKKILQFRLKSIEGFTLKELSDYTGVRYETARHEIYLCNKKGLRFQELMDEVNKEILLGRKIYLDEKFYSMVCESNDLEEVRKSIKTFYETQKLIQPENKPVIQTVIAINIPISLKDTKPLDIDN